MLGSYSELDCPLLQVPIAGLSDTVFVTLFRTTVERGSCGEHKLLRTGGVSTSLTFIVLAMADGLFGLYGSLRVGARGRAIHRHPSPHPLPPPHPFPVSKTQFVASVAVKHHNNKIIIILKIKIK